MSTLAFVAITVPFLFQRTFDTDGEALYRQISCISYPLAINCIAAPSIVTAGLSAIETQLELEWNISERHLISLSPKSKKHNKNF